MGIVKISPKTADSIIDKLIRDVGANDNEQTRSLYGKAVNNLSQARIFCHVETAQKAKTSKPGLLRCLLNKDFEELGI